MESSTRASFSDASKSASAMRLSARMCAVAAERDHENGLSECFCMFLRQCMCKYIYLLSGGVYVCFFRVPQMSQRGNLF